MSHTGSPKISVCIPTFNYGEFIAEAIESVLAQTFTDFELIVIDNCSTDGTREIVEDYVAADSRVKYVRNETNIGMVGNWNKCLEHSQGEFVKILCADDVLDVSCLEKSARILSEIPTVVLVSSARVLVDKDLCPTKTVYRYADSPEIVHGSAMITKVLMSWNTIGEPSAVLFRINAVTRGFDSNFYQQADMEMWFHLLENGDFAFLPETLCKIRLHERQTTITNVKSLLIIEDQIDLFARYQHHIPWYWPKKYILKFNLAYRLWLEQYQGKNSAEINDKIDGFLGIKMFYTLLFIKRVKKYIVSK